MENYTKKKKEENKKNKKKIEREEDQEEKRKQNKGKKLQYTNNLFRTGIVVPCLIQKDRRGLNVYFNNATSDFLFQNPTSWQFHFVDVTFELKKRVTYLSRFLSFFNQYFHNIIKNVKNSLTLHFSA